MKTVLIFTGILIVSTCLAAGCHKSEANKPATVSAANGQAVTNAECPVTGGPVKKNIWTWYNGKKVYFCCEGCKEQFERNPEQYMNKLPQYQK